MNRRQSDHLMMIIISLTILIIILTYFIEINSVVHGQGVITTKDNAQLISLSKGGTIQDIYVAEGDTVKKGELLAKVVNLDLQKEYQRYRTQKGYLDKDVNEISFILDKENESGLITLDGTRSLSNKEVKANIELVHSQIRAKDLKKTSLDSEISGLQEKLSSKEKELALLAEEINILSPLVKKGISPYTNFLNKKQAYIKVKSEINDIESSITLKKDDIELVVNDIEALNNELRLSLSKIISKNLQELEVVNSTLKVIEKQINEEDIYSPVDGVIYKINKSATTHGGVIQAADLLFEIKPKVRTMLADVKILPKYRDQIYVDETVKLDVQSIIQPKIKSYNATIDNISPDSYEENTGGTIQRYYKVIIAFDVNEDDLRWLKPGMTVDASVITGKHSIMEYLLSPLMKGVDKAFSEPVNTKRLDTP
ncbi:HlyD family type I secretion periplasmic adaptor subunit [Salmonella enterica]|nr:HlyD family type I secretion periplasmic adaptor subunit [Salmonella enterica]EGU0533434.1 HlyD family type I secretion periplasmic adaptor subunit [Salmonella enterica]EGU0547566.1 HlyD family type I secretion periplasmic adaptor subunit [Salmonella enterica]EGU0610765.1 HlyD family type I secretion periplasmic adaptor subunit [Salmonella enterica]EGU0837521.1 HlyD family type I secretion periplasmic adaptor subunit [Salmonella enterica]